jgi:hypothetical protein
LRDSSSCCSSVFCFCSSRSISCRNSFSWDWRWACRSSYFFLYCSVSSVNLFYSRFLLWFKSTVCFNW